MTVRVTASASVEFVLATMDGGEKIAALVALAIMAIIAAVMESVPKEIASATQAGLAMLARYVHVWVIAQSTVSATMEHVSVRRVIMD